jgi:hypothetical protein
LFNFGCCGHEQNDSIFEADHVGSLLFSLILYDNFRQVTIKNKILEHKYLVWAGASGYMGLKRSAIWLFLTLRHAQAPLMRGVCALVFLIVCPLHH